MYAEVKESNQLLITRPDSSEALLVKEMSDNVNKNNYKVGISDLTDESGNFGGIFLNILPNENQIFTIKEPIQQEIKINPNKIYSIVFDIEPTDFEILISEPPFGLLIDVDNKALIIKAVDLLKETIKYTIVKDGYETITGTLTIDVVPYQAIDMYILKEENIDILLLDYNKTKLIPETVESGSVKYSNITNGKYTILKKTTEEQEYKDPMQLEITEADMLKEEYVLDLTFQPNIFTLEGDLFRTTNGDKIKDISTITDETVASANYLDLKDLKIENPTEDKVYADVQCIAGDYNNLQLIYKKEDTSEKEPEENESTDSEVVKQENEQAEDTSTEEKAVYKNLITDCFGDNENLLPIAELVEKIKSTNFYVFGKPNVYNMKINLLDKDDNIIVSTNIFDLIVRLPKDECNCGCEDCSQSI